jgi:nucleotide-binding universal stress UspA family protein
LVSIFPILGEPRAAGSLPYFMFSISKIVLPLEFSEPSPDTARYARILARYFKSEVIVVHVVAPPPYEFANMEVSGAVIAELLDNRKAHIRSQLDSFESEELQGASVQRVLLEGDPAAEIVKYAHEQGAELIVMSTHGYGPFRRFILGSVTAKVLHDADCPVWTGVHKEEAPALDAIAFRNVVCAVDLGTQSAKTLGWAARFARSFEARLTLLHAVPCAGIPVAEDVGPEFRAQLVASARESIDKLQSAAGTAAEVRIEGGDAPKVVSSVCEQEAADVLVIGRGSAAGVFGRLRANAYAIIRQSPCPVVSV